MSVLDAEEINRNLDDYVERVYPKIQQFKEVFLAKVLSAVIVCSDKDLSLSHFRQYDIPHGVSIFHLDLSQVKEGDYKLILKRLSWGTKEGILFDNIDKIPNIPSKEDFEYLVHMALKRDILPTGEGVPFLDMLDFNNMLIGAKCSEYPDYLKGKSLQTIIITEHDNL